MARLTYEELVDGIEEGDLVTMKTLCHHCGLKVLPRAFSRDLRLGAAWIPVSEAPVPERKIAAFGGIIRPLRTRSGYTWTLEQARYLVSSYLWYRRVHWLAPKDRPKELAKVRLMEIHGWRRGERKGVGRKRQ